MAKPAELDLVQLAYARSAAYGLLAQGFEYPDASSFAMLRQEQRWRIWPTALDHVRPGFARLADQVREAAAASLASQSNDPHSKLQAAYDAIFGHAVSGRCVAYETEYGDSEISQRSAQLADLSGFYQAFGLELASRDNNRPDFVAAECAFMSILCAKEAHGRETGNLELTQCAANAQKAFLSDHLGRWLPAFAQRVSDASTQPFYQALSSLCAEFIAVECEMFELPVGPRWLAVRPSDPESETSISCLDTTGCGPESMACAPAAGGDSPDCFVPVNIDLQGA